MTHDYRDIGPETRRVSADGYIRGPGTPAVRIRGRVWTGNDLLPRPANFHVRNAEYSVLAMMLITVIYVLAVAVLLDAWRAHVRYMRRARNRCSASRLGNGKKQKSLKVNLR